MKKKSTKHSTNERYENFPCLTFDVFVTDSKSTYDRLVSINTIPISSTESSKINMFLIFYTKIDSFATQTYAKPIQ